MSDKTLEERAKDLAERVAGSPAWDGYEKIVVEELREASEQGRREALASLSIPGAPMTPEEVASLDRAVDRSLPRALGGYSISETERQELGRLKLLFSCLRYLQGPILDALGHGELDQFKAGMEEGKRQARLKAIEIAKDYVSLLERVRTPADFTKRYGTTNLVAVFQAEASVANDAEETV